VYLSVERDNEPSVKTIIKNGGKYERSFEFEGEELLLIYVNLLVTLGKKSRLLLSALWL